VESDQRAIEAMIQLQNKRRRTLLVLTPLIDVLFLLLIFFMLSSQIAPYSLIPLNDILNTSEQSDDTARSSESLTAGPMVVRVSHRYVAIGAQTIAIADLKAAVEDFRRQDIHRYVLIPATTANVQDIVSALEAFKAASAAEVTLINPRQAVR
jgi:biopolymer transport protein ExbD